MLIIRKRIYKFIKAIPVTLKQKTIKIFNKCVTISPRKSSGSSLVISANALLWETPRLSGRRMKQTGTIMPDGSSACINKNPKFNNIILRGTCTAYFLFFVNFTWMPHEKKTNLSSLQEWKILLLKNFQKNKTKTNLKFS